MPKIGDYETPSDSKSLTKLDGKSFTILNVEDSAYKEGDKSTPGVKITTKESFDIDGEKWNKFHTTRKAVVSKLTNEAIRDDLLHGKEIGPVKCESVKSKTGGKPYFDLVDAS